MRPSNGFILFGIATYRARILPRGAAGLIVLGSFFGLLAAVPIVFDLLGVVFGVGSAWLGYAVWSRSDQGLQ